jgi:RimJ/RimL family protein N-acetyltransferase
MTRLTVPPLEGRHVRLEPLAESHRESMRLAADHERLWAFTTTRGDGPHFDPWFDAALAESAAGRRVPFAVRRLIDAAVIGSTSYLDIAIAEGRVEIGWTWYRPDTWATAVNPECKLLMLAHAFDALHVNRVALVTDALNTRSRSAILKLGAVYEGVLRAHKLTQGGRIRDTAVYSIIAAEWPAVREGLRKRIEG